jgi:hypothetical protein
MKRTGFVSRRRTQPNQQRRRQPFARWITGEVMALTLGSIGPGSIIGANAEVIRSASPR